MRTGLPCEICMMFDNPNPRNLIQEKINPNRKCVTTRRRLDAVKPTRPGERVWGTCGGGSDKGLSVSAAFQPKRSVPLSREAERAQIKPDRVC